MTEPENRISLNELTILPHGEKAALYRMLGDEFTLLQELDFNFTQRHALGGDRWIVAIVKAAKEHNPWQMQDKDDKPAYLYRAIVEPDGAVNRQPDVPLPRLVLNQTLALKGEVVYLGGHERRAKDDDQIMGELAGYMDLSLESPTWNPLPLPVEMQEGKSIDDVLVYGDKLVLVDNIMYPKYLFEYDVSNPLKPVATKTIDLPNNGTYEHIDRGSINADWLALLSGSMGRGGAYTYVSVFSLPSYEVCLTTSLQTMPDFEYEDRDSFTTLKEELEKARNKVDLYDFCVADNYLLIALGHLGLAVFYLPELLASYRERASDFDDQDDFARHFRAGIRYSLSNVAKDPARLRTVPGMYKVHNLYPLPDGRVVIDGEGEAGFVHTRRIIDLTKNDLHA
jgi:hypothetical protein